MSRPAQDAVNTIVLRAPRDSDADAICRLVGDLGYPATPEEIPMRLRALRDSGALVVVAQVDGDVCGVATGHVLHAVHSTPPVAQLTALVVLESARGRGVGQRLVATIETWARDRGAKKLSLTSGLQRVEAHAFYEKLGFERSGVRLTKKL